MKEKIALPQELAYEGLSVDRAIEQRRSWRDFSGKEMSLVDLARLLHYASGVTEPGYGLRAAPSAGATYPIEIYPVINGVAGLARGIYHYSVPGHSLEPVQSGDFGPEMARCALEEPMMIRANAVLVLTAVWQRTQRRYRERAYRYILLEAGHIAQNVYLVATSLGLGACAIGAFHDEEFNRIIGVDGKREIVIYLMAVGDKP